MSVGFQPKNELTQDQELKIEDLSVSGQDFDLYVTEVGTPISHSDPFIASAGNYAALAGSTITNTGNSVLTGNLGISPGNALTGFPPGTISGSTDLANAAAAQAQADALAGYTALAAHGGYVTIPSALDAQVLSAGFYQFASGAATLATSAPGTLTLNGSATDVFVIKTVTTYTSGAGGAATIALTGGALAKNVYFIVGSSATINITGSSTHRGNIIANTSITATSGPVSTVLGSLIALNAAVTFSAATAVTAQSTTSSSPSINISVKINEPVDRVYNAYCKVDSSNSMYEFNQANIQIVDSKGSLSGRNQSNQPVSDKKYIKLMQYPGTSVPNNDVVGVKYRVLEHL